ncbi:MAG: thiol reductant ABC exporter subunit CydD [Wenzhouxiangella sp.]|nr:thiol reductant ABC exporter subunit CydD [Wenzhouxiangella sp.]
MEKFTQEPDTLATKSGQRQWLNERAPAWLVPSSFALAAAEAAAIIAQAALLAWILSAVIVDGLPLQTIGKSLLLLLLAWAARAAVVSFRSHVTAKASSQIRETLRDDLFRTIARAGPLQVAHSGTGRLTTGMIEQVDHLDPYYARYLPQTAVALLVPAFILIAVYPSDWLAGLLLTMTAPIIPAFMIIIGMGTEQVSSQQQDALKRLSGIFFDRLRGLDTLKRFGAERSESGRIAELSEEFRKRTMQVLRVAFLSSAVLEFFAAVAIASLAIYIGLGLLDMIDFGAATSLTLFKGLFILLLAPEFFNPLRTLAQFWHDRSSALAAAAAIREQLALPSARQEPSSPANDTPLNACEVRVNALHHGFEGRPEVLRGVNLSVSAGEKLLITGSSGGGKTTLLGLLAGFGQPDSGSITINGQNLNDFSTEQLSTIRGYLGQRPLLMPASLAANIRLADPDASDEAVKEAAQQAGLADLIRQLPEGLDTLIGQDAFGISGGQARRIALARVLLKPYPLLLLDEPTASLDDDTGDAVWQALNAAAEQTPMTMICISHSDRAKRWADRVVTLQKGQLEVAAHG